MVLRTSSVVVLSVQSMYDLTDAWIRCWLMVPLSQLVVGTMISYHTTVPLLYRYYGCWRRALVYNTMLRITPPPPTSDKHTSPPRVYVSSKTSVWSSLALSFDTLCITTRRTIYNNNILIIKLYCTSQVRGYTLQSNNLKLDFLPFIESRGRLLPSSSVESRRRPVHQNHQVDRRRRSELRSRARSFPIVRTFLSFFVRRLSVSWHFIFFWDFCLVVLVLRTKVDHAGKARCDIDTTSAEDTFVQRNPDVLSHSCSFCIVACVTDLSSTTPATHGMPACYRFFICCTG